MQLINQMQANLDIEDFKIQGKCTAKLKVVKDLLEEETDLLKYRVK